MKTDTFPQLCWSCALWWKPLAIGAALLTLGTASGFAQTTRPASAKRKASRSATTANRLSGATETTPRAPKSKYPPLETRLAAYCEQLETKKIKREDTQPYLIAGVEVLGISETADGTAAAFIRVEDGTTLVVRAGMHFYDGVLERIEPRRLIFRLNNQQLVEKRYGQPIGSSPENPTPREVPENTP
jgi:hypothetical protein